MELTVLFILSVSVTVVLSESSSSPQICFPDQLNGTARDEGTGTEYFMFMDFRAKRRVMLCISEDNNGCVSYTVDYNNDDVTIYQVALLQFDNGNLQDLAIDLNEMDKTKYLHLSPKFQCIPASAEVTPGPYYNYSSLATGNYRSKLYTFTDEQGFSPTTYQYEIDPSTRLLKSSSVGSSLAIRGYLEAHLEGFFVKEQPFKLILNLSAL